MFIIAKISCERNMVKVSKCCCCVPIKTGTYIIGWLQVVGSVLFIFTGNALALSLTVFCAASFLLMFFRDSE